MAAPVGSVPGVPRTNWVVDTARTITREWDQWLQRLIQKANQAAAVVGSASGSAQAASISTTDLPTTDLTAGVYRAGYAMEVTRAATVSSSLTATIGWTTPDGVAKSQAGAALTTNTTAAQQNGTVLMNVDAGSSVTYALAYASSGATTMQYAFSVTLEALPNAG